MAKNNHAKGAKAPDASKENKQKKDNVKAEDVNKDQNDKSTKDSTENKEWLEEELDNVKLDDDTDALMKRAAEQIEKYQAEIKEWKDNYMRLHAEWDTYRRRTTEQREAEKAIATEALVTDILPVLDDFERSIAYAKDNGETGLLEGVEAVHSKLISALEKNGTNVLNPEKGTAFDALEHQAVSTVEDKEEFEESIASVMQKGYKMGNKVIRPATVSVTTGGKTRPKEEAEEAKEEETE